VPSWRLRRRLSPELIAEIADKYCAGATTPALCLEYSLSKGGVLKLLHEQGVELRCQPLSPEQVEHAATLYTHGSSIQAIADRFGVSYNGVRQAFVRAGIERRTRGGSRRRA
jgi:transposase-like protein